MTEKDLRKKLAKILGGKKLASSIISKLGIEEYELPAYDFQKHKFISVWRIRSLEEE